jgi:hypothetical protein
MDVAAMLRGNVKRCSRTVLDAAEADRQSANIGTEMQRQRVKAVVVERSNSAVQLFELVSEQVERDVAAGLGDSKMILYRSAGSTGSWKLLLPRATPPADWSSKGTLSADDYASLQLVKEIFEGFKYRVEDDTPRKYAGTYCAFNVIWRSPEYNAATAESNAIASAWDEMKDIIKAQAAGVLDAQQSESGQEEEADYDNVSMPD